MNKSAIVVDTMALVLRLEKRRMLQRTKEYFLLAESAQIDLFVPAMVLAEIGYLAERKRIDITLPDVADYFRRYPTINVCPLTEEIVAVCFQIDDVPELHDRLITATAVHLGCNLVTNDPKIEASEAVETIWA